MARTPSFPPLAPPADDDASPSAITARARIALLFRLVAAAEAADDLALIGDISEAIAKETPGDRAPALHQMAVALTDRIRENAAVRDDLLANDSYRVMVGVVNRVVAANAGADILNPRFAFLFTHDQL